MKKTLLLLCATFLAGCLATENRKVEITMRGIADVDSSSAATISTEIWWRTPYYADRPTDNEWDRFIPAEDLPEHLRPKSGIDADLEHFRENVVRWPKTMREPYRPSPIWVTPAPKKTDDSAIRERLKQLLLSPHQSEVY